MTIRSPSLTLARGWYRSALSSTACAAGPAGPGAPGSRRRLPNQLMSYLTSGGSRATGSITVCLAHPTFLLSDEEKDPGLTRGRDTRLTRGMDTRLTLGSAQLPSGLPQSTPHGSGRDAAPQQVKTRSDHSQ